MERSQSIHFVAILISIAVFLFTLANQTEQNRRWDNLNLGNAVIKQVQFTRFNTLSIEEAKKINWGYDVLLLQPEDEQDKVFSIYCLQIFDKATNQVVPYSKFCRTIQDVNEELQDLKIPAANVIVKRVSKIIITIENIGKTEIRNLSTIVKVERPNGNWEIAFASAEKLTLGGSQIAYVPLTLYFRLADKTPEQMKFNIKMEYQDANENNHMKSQNIKWIRREDKWSFLEAEETTGN